MKNKFALFAFLLLINSSLLFSQVAINTDGSEPNSSAMLDIKSNNKGILPPRMSRAEINAIASPANGLIVYCTDCGPLGTGALTMYMAGSWVRLATSFMEPTVTTTEVTAVAQPTATSGGNVTSDGGSAITARGVCWATAPNPTIANSTTTDGTGFGSFTSNLIGLAENTAYYVRAYSTNSAGTGYGNEVSFTTLAGSVPDTVTDIDGNVYHTVTIGTQTWMVENLKTTKYRNGDPIPSVTGDWSALVTGAYSWYNNDVANKAVYGGYYNWYAVVDSRNMAPAGWHVPTDADWTTLTDFLGGEWGSAGAKLKETGTSHWMVGYGTNDSGFTALPGGTRSRSADPFMNVGYVGYWWSSTAFSDTKAWIRLINYDSSSFGRSSNYDKIYGFSVRCLRD